MEPTGHYSAAPDSITTDAANSACAVSTTTGGEAQNHVVDSPTIADADSTTGRTPDCTKSGTGPGSREPQQRAHSFSLGAIPTDQIQHRDKKRSSARASLPAGYPEATHRSDEAAYGHSPQQVPLQQISDSLPRPYPLQSKSFGYAPKNLARSMGSTALPREDSPGGFGMESLMAKGDPGRAVRINHRAPVPHGMSRSLPKQSYFPSEEGAYYPSRSALCLHDLPQKQQYADHYYSPQMIRKADPRVSSSSSFKPKRHDNRREIYYDPYSGLIAPSNYGEYRKQWYTGDNLYHQGHHHQYAVHMMQETGRNEAFREAGDNAVLKSSGDSGGELSKCASQQQSANDPSSMYVYVRDAQTSTDTPVPATMDVDESPPPSKAAEMPLLGEDGARQNEGSSSSSSSDEEEEVSSSESSSGSATPVNKAGDATSTLLLAEAVPQQLMAQHIQLQHQQAMQMTKQEYAEYQETLRSYDYYQQKQQLHPLHPMHQQAMQQQMVMQHLKQLQLQHKQQLQYQQQIQQQQLQMQQDQESQQPQQQPMDSGSGQYDKKRAFYFTGGNADGEMVVRTPGEGASLRSFQSRTSGVESGGVEASGEDNRSVLSSSTNMGTPLLRPPQRAKRSATKDKMEHLCLAVNVILFSVLAGVVAAFIVQQVTHAI